ncbi:MAG: peptidylprolyl isomerase [Terriglobales bacterium]
MPAPGRPRRLLPLTAVLLWAACRAGTGAPAPGVLALVNGQPVTQAELDRLYADQTSGASSPLPAQQSLQLRLSLLNQLIDREILLQYGARLGLKADPAAVAREVALDRARQPETPEAELRQQANDNLVLTALLQREVGDKVQVRDAEIATFYQQNQASFHLPERQYHVLEIVVTPSPAPVTNLAEDKAATPAAAMKKIAMLQQRLAQHADFATLAQQYSEDSATASSGGDMGLIPQSVLDSQTPPRLRAAILALKPGQVSPVVATGGGYYLLKLVGIEPAGLRPLSDPQVRQSIRDLLANGRQQVLQSAFLTTVRDQATVVNYYAQQILAGNGQ